MRFMVRNRAAVHMIAPSATYSPQGETGASATCPTEAGLQQVDYLQRQFITEVVSALDRVYTPCDPGASLAEYADPSASRLDAFMQHEGIAQQRTYEEVCKRFRGIREQGGFSQPNLGQDEDEARDRVLRLCDEVAHRNGIITHVIDRATKRLDAYVDAKDTIDAIGKLKVYPPLDEQSRRTIAKDIVDDFVDSVIGSPEGTLEANKAAVFDALSRTVGYPEDVVQKQATAMARCVRSLKKDDKPAHEDVVNLENATVELFTAYQNAGRKTLSYTQLGLPQQLLVEACKSMLKPGITAGERHNVASVMYAMGLSPVVASEAVQQDEARPPAEAPHVQATAAGPSHAVPAHSADPTPTNINITNWLDSHPNTGRVAVATLVGATIFSAGATTAAAAPPGQPSSSYGGLVTISDRRLVDSAAHSALEMNAPPEPTTPEPTQPAVAASANTSPDVASTDTWLAEGVAIEPIDEAVKQVSPGSATNTTVHTDDGATKSEVIEREVGASFTPVQEDTLTQKVTEQKAMASLSLQQKVEHYVGQYSQQGYTTIQTSTATVLEAFVMQQTDESTAIVTNPDSQDRLAYATLIAKMPELLKDEAFREKIKELMGLMPSVNLDDIQYLNMYVDNKLKSSFYTRKMVIQDKEHKRYSPEELDTIGRLIVLADIYNNNADAEAYIAQQKKIDADKAAAEKAAREREQAENTPPQDTSPSEKSTSSRGSLEEGASDVAEALAAQGDNWYYRAFLTDYLMRNAGLKDFQASALVGGFVHETGSESLPPDKMQNGGGPGFSWAQWEKGGSRYNALKALAEHMGKPVDDPDVLAQHIVNELKGNGFGGDDLRASKTFDEAAAIAMGRYEIPYDYLHKDENPEAYQRNLELRKNHGRTILGAYQKKTVELGAKTEAGQSPEARAKAICDGLDIEFLGATDGYTNGEKQTIYLCKIQGEEVNTEIAKAVVTLIRLAAEQGINLTLTSGFRSDEEQRGLRIRNKCPDEDESPSSSCLVPTAKAGYSNHQMGNAIDFGVDGVTIDSRDTVGFRFLAKHAPELGLHNFPDEAWHWSVNGR